MKDKDTLLKLFYLITMADGVMNDKEMELGKKLISYYNLDEKSFYEHLQGLTKKSYDLIYKECVTELLKLNTKFQIEYLAWVGLVANSDGFMDKKEWELLYKLYSKELKLNLQDIINKQRELMPFITKSVTNIK